MWPGAPRSMPEGSFLARAASALLTRAHVASRLSILCSSRSSTNSSSGVSRHRDRTGPIPFHPEPPKKGPGRGARRWRGPLASWVRAGLPVVGVRCQPPAGCLLAPRQVERTTNRTPARLWCAYRAHPRCLGGPNTTGAPASLNAAKMAADLGATRTYRATSGQHSGRQHVQRRTAQIRT